MYGPSAYVGGPDYAAPVNDPSSTSGGAGGGNQKGQTVSKKYGVILKILNDCLAALGINTTIYALTPSVSGGTGYALGVGTDTYSRGGSVVPILVANDAGTYNAAQLGTMCHVSWAYGCTPPGNPYQNYTNNNNNAFGTVLTQIHELGHSLFQIQSGTAAIPEPYEIGQALEDCVKKNNGIQPMQ